jgi:hypothetical protein
MPTDSALAVGIFVGVCIISADARAAVKPQHRETATRAGIALNFGKSFIVGIPVGISSGTRAARVIDLSDDRRAEKLPHRFAANYSRSESFGRTV